MPGTAADRPQQLGEQRPDAYHVTGLPRGQGEVAAVAVDVLAEQGDLA